MKYADIVASWNAMADDFNPWDSLSEEEKIEFAAASKWRIDEPPKDGSPFLADFGHRWPWPVVATWNGCDECYVYANLQCGMVDGIWNDTYFENEQEKTIKRWMHMPELSNGN